MRPFLTFILLAFIFWGACDNESQKNSFERSRSRENSQRELARAGQQAEQTGSELAKSVKNFGGDVTEHIKVEPLDFRDLQKLLPRDLSGMKRTDLGGEKKAILGIKMSEAQATYEGKKEGEITIQIKDLGTLKNIAFITRFAWTSAEIDRETSTGYAKTVKINGHKGYQEYDREKRDGKFIVIVADRFVVEVNGDDVDEKDLKKAFEKIDLRWLERKRNEGVEK